MDLKNSEENPVKLVAFKVPMDTGACDQNATGVANRESRSDGSNVTITVNGSVINGSTNGSPIALHEPDAGVRLVGFTRSSSLGRGDPMCKQPRGKLPQTPDDLTAKQRLMRLKAEAKEWLTQKRTESCNDAKKIDKDVFDKFIQENKEHLVELFENFSHRKGMEMPSSLSPGVKYGISAPPSPIREPKSLNIAAPLSCRSPTAESVSSNSSKASACSSTSSKKSYQMSTSKSVFEFCVDTNTYRFSTERMTQSYEQSFDFSESEDEDEGTETASCSSREEDITSCESTDGKNTHLVEKNAYEKNEADSRLAAFRVAQELLSSERSYVKILNLIDQVFQFRIDQENRVRPMFPREVITRMFSNIKSIYKLHNDFLLPQLEQRMAVWEETPKIGDIMKNFAPFLKMYTEYVKNFDEANSTVSLWLTKSQRFATIVEEIQKLPACGSLTLQHHMLAPVQRVPRYELLIKDYLRKLPDDSPDHVNAEESLQLVASAANRSNEAAKKIDKFKKLLEVQDMVGGSVDLVSPTRELLKSEKLFKISARSGDHQERHLFLFTDLLLLCSAKRIANRVYSSGPTLRVRARLPVSGLEVIEGDNLVTANTFYIRNKNKSIELYTQSPEEREEWLKSLEQAVDELQKRKSSLKIGTEQANGVDNASSNGPIPVSPPVVTNGTNEVCHMCKSAFGTFRRKQLCRACNRIVCGKCFGQKVLLPNDNGGRPQRVCKLCHELFSSGRVAQNCPSSSSSPSATSIASSFVNIFDGSSSSECSSSLNSVPASPTRDVCDRSSIVILRRGILEVKATDESVLNGFLHLKTRGKSWSERWFLLKSDFVLYSFATQKDVRAMTSTPVPGFQVSPCERSDSIERENAFKLFHKKKVYYFQAASSEDMQRWVNALEKASRAEFISP